MGTLEYTIGVDLGGTNVRAGLVRGVDLVKQAKARIPKTDNAEEVLLVIFGVIDEVINDHVESIGIGVPGLVNRNDMSIHSVVNIPSFVDIPLGKILKERYACEVVIDNDANCFALGEFAFGKGRGRRNIVGLTLGTGLGGGIISAGRLLEDANRGSGEFGEVPYLDGIVENYCSGQFFRDVHHCNGEDLLEKAKANDPQALQIFSEFGSHMAYVIKIVNLTIDPEMIIIGGSVAQSYEYFHSSMMEALHSHTFASSISKLEIVYSNIENVAILGASELVRDFHLD